MSWIPQFNDKLESFYCLVTIVTNGKLGLESPVLNLIKNI